VLGIVSFGSSQKKGRKLHIGSIVIVPGGPWTAKNNAMFNETEWIKLVMLLGDTQAWLESLCTDTIRQYPVGQSRKFLKRNYYLGIKALAHIIERHCTPHRWPHAGKFSISLTELLYLMRNAGELEPGLQNDAWVRQVETGREIGHDKWGQPATCLTIITDAGGKIVTAYPGKNDCDK
jgi:hypothetical protein